MSTPTPHPDDELFRLFDLAQYGWVVVAILLLFVAVGAGMTWAILQSAKYPHPTMLVLTLSIITLGLVGIYTIYGPLRTDVMPLASAALGALVATLTQSNRNDNDKFT